MSIEPRPITVFVMMNKSGHIWPDGARHYRRYVIGWADQMWSGQGGYQQARKEGWRIVKVRIAPLPSEV